MAVQKFPVPKTIKNVQSFLGLTGYFRKFIKDYSLIAKPLSDLTRNTEKFQIGALAIESFNKLKESLSKQPILQIYSQDAQTELHTDACKYGIGSILFQISNEDNKLHPVYYFSRKTQSSEENYTSYELEVLAIISSLKKFRTYLLGIKFKIVTDCSAFKMTMEKKEISSRISRWALMLQDYEYTIEHRSGSRMKHVDALSRNPCVLLLDNDFINRIKSAQHKDEKLKTIFKVLETENDYNDFLVEGNILYKNYNGRNLLVIPEGMQTEIVRKTHEQGHFALFFWWRPLGVTLKGLLLKTKF